MQTTPSPQTAGPKLAPPKLAGPEHPITITHNPRRVRVRFQNHVIADSDATLMLREADYAPAIYFPREDVETGFLSKTARSSTCPYKGQASYYCLMMDGRLVENAAWSYDAPYPAMAEIGEMLSFYPDKVEIYELDETERANPQRGEFI